jgi:hypothetical protein
MDGVIIQVWHQIKGDLNSSKYGTVYNCNTNLEFELQCYLTLRMPHLTKFSPYELGGLLHLTASPNVDFLVYYKTFIIITLY